MSKIYQKTTKYPCVYIDDKGNFFYQIDLGKDKITGKRVRKKGRKDIYGKKFESASEANKEVIRLKNEYYKVKCYSNYDLKYDKFMIDVYIPFYKTDVQESTFNVKKEILNNLIKIFGDKRIRDITALDVQNFRTNLLLSEELGGMGYSQAYASLIFDTFRKTLDKAVELNFIESNVSRKIKAIPKAKSNVEFWTKEEFEKILKCIDTRKFDEHLNFVMLWLYFITGIRVNEGTALKWKNVDFKNKKLEVYNMLILNNRNDWKINKYTKTDAGKRKISLDDDTLDILNKWRNRQEENNLGKDENFIFTCDSLPMIKSTISRIINKYSKIAGVKRIQIKGLRHSHASYLINEFNASVLIVSKRLGHSSPEITLKYYSHLWGCADEEIVSKIKGNIKY